MKHTNSSRISKASNESVAMLSKRVLEAVEQSNIQEALNGKAYLAHAELSSQFAKAAEKLKRKELSEPVNKHYNDRRDLFAAMYVYAKGLCNAPDAEMAEAAQQVFKALNLYGQFLGNLKVEVQSFRYIRIIEALKQPELVAALTKMQLTAKVAELDNVQRAYENQFADRSNKIKGNVSASSLRRALNEAIKLHIDELNWLARQTESEALRKLCFEVNARVADLVMSSQRNGTEDETVTETLELPAQSA
jgi:predicted metalloendopeptidase